MPIQDYKRNLLTIFKKISFYARNLKQLTKLMHITFYINKEYNSRKDRMQNNKRIISYNKKKEKRFIAKRYTGLFDFSCIFLLYEFKLQIEHTPFLI